LDDLDVTSLGTS